MAMGYGYSYGYDYNYGHGVCGVGADGAESDVVVWLVEEKVW